jgi:hypothetical protein
MRFSRKRTLRRIVGATVALDGTVFNIVIVSILWIGRQFERLARLLIFLFPFWGIAEARAVGQAGVL